MLQENLLSCLPLIRTRCNLLQNPFLKPNQEGKPEEEEEDVAVLKKKMEETRTEVESILQKSGQEQAWLVGRHHAKNASHTSQMLVDCKS